MECLREQEFSQSFILPQKQPFKVGRLGETEHPKSDRRKPLDGYCDDLGNFDYCVVSY